MRRYCTRRRTVGSRHRPFTLGRMGRSRGTLVWLPPVVTSGELIEWEPIRCATTDLSTPADE